MSVEIKETLAVFSRQSFTVIWLEMEASTCCRTLFFSDNSGFRGEAKARVDGRWLEEIKKTLQTPFDHFCVGAAERKIPIG